MPAPGRNPGTGKDTPAHLPMEGHVMTLTIDHPAINDYVRQVEHNARRDTIRRLLELARAGTLTVTQASRVALGAGMPLTPVDVEDGVRFLEDADHPAAALDRHEFDEGPVSGDRHDMLTRIASVAQQDLDTLVDTAARNATPVAVETALLAAINVLAVA